MIEVQHFMYLNMAILLLRFLRGTIEVQHFMYLNLFNLVLSISTCFIEVQHFMYLNMTSQHILNQPFQLKFNILCI